MEWLKSIAPMAGAALAGPFGSIAATYLADRIGLDAKTVTAVTDALSGGALSPEQISNIKLAENDMTKFMVDNGIKADTLAAEDRRDARAMQVATHSRMPAALTIMVTLGFFGVLITLLLMPKMADNQIVLVMVGQLSAVWGACVAFYVSTTFSSASKNQLLANSKGTP